MSCDQNSFTSIKPWQTFQKIQIKELKDEFIFKDSAFLLVKKMNVLFPSVRNLPDVTAENFSKVDLRQFKWIHWEVSELWRSWNRFIISEPAASSSMRGCRLCRVFHLYMTRSSTLRLLLQVWLIYVWLHNVVIVWSAGPKRWRTGEDDPAGRGVQHLCAARTENNRFRGDREDQGTALPAVSARWRGACFWPDEHRRVSG